MTNLFHFDSLSKISLALILIISSIVAIFSINYLRGDKNRPKFFVNLIFFASCMVAMASSNNILMMAVFLMLGNIFLVLMMIHKSSWKQAYNSGVLALKNFTIGFICLVLAFLVMKFSWGISSIDELIAKDLSATPQLHLFLGLILLSAMTQSAIYPFSSWILSSLNSPTPVSAIMHAGLVNGGGIILARFAPLFFKTPDFLTLIFVIGIITAIIGTSWKLIQANVKSMLACSTVSQMGFMIAQIGMGLFPAAIAHLFWHGMFKSYLFLSSSNIWREKRFDLGYPPKISSFLIACIFGVLGAIIFATTSKLNFSEPTTVFVLMFMSFVAATQIAISIIDKISISKLSVAATLSALSSALYGFSVYLIEDLLSDLGIFIPQEINFWHVLAVVVLFTMWLARLFTKNLAVKNQIAALAYVKLLNQSQPNLRTITSNRNNYNF